MYIFYFIVHFSSCVHLLPLCEFMSRQFKSEIDGLKYWKILHFLFSVRTSEYGLSPDWEVMNLRHIYSGNFFESLQENYAYVPIKRPYNLFICTNRGSSRSVLADNLVACLKSEASSIDIDVQIYLSTENVYNDLQQLSTIHRDSQSIFFISIESQYRWGLFVGNLN